MDVTTRTIDRRAFLKGTLATAVAVRIVGTGNASAAPLTTKQPFPGRARPPTVGGPPTMPTPQLAPSGYVGDVVGPPEGAATNVLRSSSVHGGVRQHVWRSGGGRKLVVNARGREVDVCYHDPVLVPHGCFPRTSTVGELEHELRSHFGTATYLELLSLLRRTFQLWP